MITNYVNKYFIPLFVVIFIFTIGETLLNNILKVLAYVTILIPAVRSNLLPKLFSNDIFSLLLFVIYSILTVIAFCYFPNIQLVNIYVQLLCFCIILKYYDSKQFNNIKIFYCIIIIVGLMLQLSLNKTGDYRAFVPSVQDPNYTSYYILLLVILCDINNRTKYSIIIAILGLLTLSRSYILCLSAYFIFSRLKSVSIKISNILNRFHISFLFLIILSLFIVFGISYYFMSLSVSDFTGASDYNSVTDKLFHFQDGSNRERTLVNILFLEELINNTTSYLWGTDIDVYLKNIQNVPHNSILLGLLKFGLPFIFYLLLFSRLISKKIINNISLLIPLFLNIMFLGLGICGLDIIPLSIIIASSSSKYNTIKNENNL